MFSQIIHTIEQWLDQFSYFGVFLGMFIESLNFPLPSEVVMGIGAHYVRSNGANPILMILAGVAGNILGSGILFWTAKKGGEKLLKKDFKYFSLKKIHKLEKYITKYGYWAVFFAQMLPIIRSVAPIPAGLLKMDYRKYLLASVPGITIWCGVLMYVAMGVLESFDRFKETLHPEISIPILVFLICAIFLGKYFLERRAIEKENKEEVKS
jgi:membrane protein DedA with SNARE-associated domain